MFTAATHSTQLTQLTLLALEISQHSSSSGLQKLARFQEMACLRHKSGHIGSFVSFCRRLEVRLLQRRSASHFRKCAIAARQNGNIFNPVMTQTAGVSSGERETGVGADQVKPVLKVAKLSKNATIPTKASAKAAGFDLYSAHDCSIDSMEKAIINTDIQVAVPPGYYGRVAPRSGLAVNHFIDVGAGVVDEDYRGNVGVVLFNFSKEPFEVHKGDRIAQLICERICHPALEQCEVSCHVQPVCLPGQSASNLSSYVILPRHLTKRDAELVVLDRLAETEALTDSTSTLYSVYC